MQTDPWLAPRCLRCGLADIAVVKLECSLNDVDARRIGVDVDVAPPQPGELAHAGDYIGSTDNIAHRLAEHRSGRGARLIEVTPRPASVSSWPAPGPATAP